MTAEFQRAEVAGPEPEPSAAREMDAVALDLGGVVVELFGLGPAHTCGDLMVGIPGGESIRRTPGTPATYATPATPGVLFAGDG